jgi:CTP synthase (UTP-ammonia lyase)
MEEQKRTSLTVGQCVLELGNDLIRFISLQNLRESTISERHRHRYEYNSAYVDALQSRIESVRVNPDTGLVEIVE